MALAFLPGCSVAEDLEMDSYTGAFSVPNLGKRAISANTLEMTVWYNQGKVEGTGKVVIEDLPLTANSTTWVDTYELKFTGKYDGKTGLLNGLVTVTGGTVCKSNCSGMTNSPYNHSSYWQAQEVSGKVVNGQVSAYPDFKTSYLLFEANPAKAGK